MKVEWRKKGQRGEIYGWGTLRCEISIKKREEEEQSEAGDTLH